MTGLRIATWFLGRDAPSPRAVSLALVATVALGSISGARADQVGITLDGARGRLPVLRGDVHLSEVGPLDDLLLVGVSRASDDPRPDRLAGSVRWRGVRLDAGAIRHAVLSGGLGGGSTELRDGGRWRTGDAVRVSRSITAPIGVHLTVPLGPLTLRGGRWSEVDEIDPVHVLAIGSRAAVEGWAWEVVGARHGPSSRAEIAGGRITRTGGVLIGVSAESPPDSLGSGGRAVRVLVRQRGPSRSTVRMVWERVLDAFVGRPAGFSRPAEGWGIRVTRDRVSLEHRARLGVYRWSRTTGVEVRGPRGTVSWSVRLAHRRTTDRLGRDPDDAASVGGRVAHRRGAWRGELRLLTRASPADGELGLLAGATVTWRVRRHLQLTAALLEAQATDFPSAVSLGAAGLVPLRLDPGDRAVSLRLRWRGLSVHAVEIVRGDVPGWRMSLGVRGRR